MRMTKKNSERVNRAKAAKLLTADELFFYDNAGFSYPVGTSPEAGRLQCARDLAKAEANAKNIEGWEFTWGDDWTTGDHTKEFDTYGTHPETCEFCVLKDADGNVLASLGCIDDATPAYRRVVEAELAIDALATYYADADTADVH